jgi:hypothetical protein
VAGALVQRCTVHKHRNLLAHAPRRLHEALSNDYHEMIYARTAKEIEARRKAFIRKWRLKCRAVADSLEEAGDRLCAFTRWPNSQWHSAHTTNAIERLHEEFKRVSRRRPCFPQQKLQPCCSGHCWRPDQSICVRSTAGKPSPRPPHLNALILPHDALPEPTGGRATPISTKSATRPSPRIMT